MFGISIYKYPNIMIKIIFLASIFCFAATIDSGAQYSINKEKYDYRSYSKEPGDPYNPLAAGIASLYIPGLGQMIFNEVPRGASFLAGYAGCWLIVGMGWIYFNRDISNTYSIRIDDPGVGLMIVGLSSVMAVQIWSAVDAVRVAKVNNLAWRDRDKTSSTSIMIAPSINLTPEHKPIPAIMAAVRF